MMWVMAVSRKKGARTNKTIAVFVGSDLDFKSILVTISLVFFVFFLISKESFKKVPFDELSAKYTDCMSVCEVACCRVEREELRLRIFFPTDIWDFINFFKKVLYNVRQ